MLEPPSGAELAVLRLMATDLSTREIGERLFLSPNTIRSHKRALYHKLGVHSRSGRDRPRHRTRPAGANRITRVIGARFLALAGRTVPWSEHG